MVVTRKAVALRLPPDLAAEIDIRAAGADISRHDAILGLIRAGLGHRVTAPQSGGNSVASAPPGIPSRTSSLAVQLGPSTPPPGSMLIEKKRRRP